jgi:hypothetical protein
LKKKNGWRPAFQVKLFDTAAMYSNGGGEQGAGCRP